jgi:subtilisin
VTGLVAARACTEGDYVGIAPGVVVIVARVFSETTGRAGHDDVANAIEALVRDHGVHLINLSFGGANPVPVEHEAILDALDSGTVVLAASGNENGPVQFPAAYEEVIAVGALGRLGEGSELARSGTYVADGEPFDASGGLYPADFSCHGPEVTCIAPGVDIISTVPSSASDACEFAAMTGTSMATPIACAALAMQLAQDREYLRMNPTRERADYALGKLLGACRDLGFPEARQGAGLPVVP